VCRRPGVAADAAASTTATVDVFAGTLTATDAGPAIRTADVGTAASGDASLAQPTLPTASQPGPALPGLIDPPSWAPPRLGWRRRPVSRAEPVPGWALTYGGGLGRPRVGPPLTSTQLCSGRRVYEATAGGRSRVRPCVVWYL
jgi:hypothetical protein